MAAVPPGQTHSRQLAPLHPGPVEGATRGATEPQGEAGVCVGVAVTEVTLAAGAGGALPRPQCQGRSEPC